MYHFFGFLALLGLIYGVYKYREQANSDLKKARWIILVSGSLFLIFTALATTWFAMLAGLLGMLSFVASGIGALVTFPFKRPLAKKMGAICLASLLILTVMVGIDSSIASEDLPQDQVGEVVDQDQEDPSNESPGLGATNGSQNSGSQDTSDSQDENSQEPSDSEPDSQDTQNTDPDEADDPDEKESQESKQEPDPKDEKKETPPDKPAGEMAVHFIDVGQGDAILLQAQGKNILIDGGGRSAGTTVVNYLRGQGVNQLDLVIATHPHEDHIGGLIEVFRQIPVTEVWDPGVAHTTQTFENYLDIIDSKDIKFTEARVGMTANLGGAKLEVLHPRNVSVRHLNDSSIVTRVDFGEHSFLFTGDAESASEANMSGLKPVTVLKIGHHGSRTSTTQSFLNATSPKYAVITVGANNRYGHPHSEVLNRLRSAGVQTYRSDLHGTIVMRSNGTDLNVSTNRNPSSSEIYTPPGSDDDEDDEDEPDDSSQTDKPGKFAASRNSDIFHKADCQHVSNIADHNIIWFQSIEEASKDRRPCAICEPTL